MNTVDEHPLDKPLGDIHEVALMLSMLSKRMPWETNLIRMALQLAEAHEAIQNWVLKEIRTMVTE